MSALDRLLGMVLEDGSRWGDVAASWQVEDARAVLEPGDGPRLHFETRPRGGSKTTDVAGVVVCWLLDQARPGDRGFVIASDAEQGVELIDAADGLLRRSGVRESQVRVLADRLVNPVSGASVQVLAADAAGAFGRRPALTVVDELTQWGTTKATRRLWSAAVSAVPKVPGGRLVVLTTAGDPSHWSYKILEQARKSPRWRVSEVAGPLPWRTEDDLAEQRALLLPWEFDRLHLNRWSAGDDKLVDVEKLRAAVRLPGVTGHHEAFGYVIGLDVAYRRDNTVAAVCHAETVGERFTVVLDRLEVWTPPRGGETDLQAVEDRVVELSREYGHALVNADPAKAEQMLQRLQRRNVGVAEFKFTEQSVGKLGALLFQLLNAGDLWLYDDPDLLDELAHVRLVERISGPRLDHDSDRHDDRAVALALAATYLRQWQPWTSLDPPDVPAPRPYYRHLDPIWSDYGYDNQRAFDRLMAGDDGGDVEREGYTGPTDVDELLRRGFRPI